MELNMVNIEAEIEQRFINAFRQIFEKDDVFVYNEDDTLTNLIISLEYPQTEAPFKTSQLILTDISYNFNKSTAMFNNYCEDIYDKNILIGHRAINIIPYTLTLICLGERFNSKDLANKALSYITFVYENLFLALRLNIRNVSKAPTRARQHLPEKIFETSISVEGYLDWTGVTLANDLHQLNVLKKVKI